MASLRHSVLRHHKRKDNQSTYNVKIAVAHKGKTGYIATDINVVKKMLDPQFKIKDIHTLSKVLNKIKPYQEILEDIYFNISDMSAPELARYLEETKEKRDQRNIDASTIDFVKFSEEHIAKIRKEGKQGIIDEKILEQKRKRKEDRERYADKIQATLWSLCDFLKNKSFPITYISAGMLKKYEDYLRGPRTMTRMNQYSRPVTTTRKGLSESSVIDYMVNIRTLYNAAITEYNDDDLEVNIIRRYPFTKYKIPEKKEREKRDFEWDIIQLIQNFPDDEDKPLIALGRDIFMLQFYLAGMNSIDLYNVTKYHKSTLTYNRTKTKRIRKDNALMTITVPPEASYLVDKYKDHKKERVFNFHQTHSTSSIFNRAVGKGLKAISERLMADNKIDTPIKGYDSRRGWADIAHNVMDIPKDTVGLGLNHVDKDHKTTDIYIKKKFSKVDKANRIMLDALNARTNKKKI